MHGQSNHTNQVGQGFYAPGPTFQQRPPTVALPPPPPHRGPFTPPLQAFQQGNPSFPPTSGISLYQHAIPTVPHQGPSAPVVSSGRGSSQSYTSHTQPPQLHVRNQTPHSYHTPEQHMQWGQNVHSLPPTAPHPSLSTYPLPYSSTSSFLTSAPLGSSAHGIRQHWTLPPPPPRPLPPLPTSPPRVPPLPPSSPQSVVPLNSKNDGSSSLKELLVEDNLIVEHPPQPKSAEDINVHQNEVPCHHHIAYDGHKLESIDAVDDHSPSVSDMEMEDDITHADEKNDHLSTNSNAGGVSFFQEDYAKEKLQNLQHTGEHRVPSEGLHENLLFAEASLLKDHTGGMTKDGRTELPSDATVNGSSQYKFTSQPSVTVACEETDYGKLSDQLIEGENPSTLLQGYASGKISENECENIIGDVNSPALLNVGSSTFDDPKVCNFGSKVRVESLLESNKHISPKSMVESPRNVTDANELPSVPGVFEKHSGKICRGQESVTSAAVQSKDSLRNCDAHIDLEGAKDYNQDMKGNITEKKVDEFGRLVREGYSDSDTSDSPHYRRRHARRARKRSSSRSRSRSPRNRRRSPRRRKARPGRSHSSSPKRQRSRSRSPVLRRNTEFGGGKRRMEKSQLPECFNFIRGKCHHGSSCRYLHHETGKSVSLRYNRGKQRSSLRSPDARESKVPYDKETKDKILPRDTSKLREVRDAKELTADFCTHSLDKINSVFSGSLPVADETSHHSVYSVNGMDSGNRNTLMLKSPAQYSDEMPQIADQQGKRMADSLISESSSFVQASAHLSADKHDAKSGPTNQLLPVESPISEKPFPTEEVESQSLKGLPTSVASHPPEFNLPLPPVSQVTSAPGQDYNLMPPSSTLENNTPYQTTVSYQHSHIPGQSNPLPNPFLPPPPPPPHHLSVNVIHGEPDNHSQHTHHSLQPPCDGLPSYTSIRAQPTELTNHIQSFQYQTYPLPQEPDQMLNIPGNFASSSLPVINLPSLQSGLRIIGDHVTGHAVQGMDPLHSVSQAQSYSLGGGLPPDSNSSQGHPYFQQTSYDLQYSGGGVSAQFSQPEKVNSSMSSRTTQDFLGQNQPSYANNSAQSRIASRFNPYSSTFDRTLSSKFKFNVSTQENDTIISTKHGAPDSSSVPMDMPNVSSVDQALSVLPRIGGDQYDPLLDSIEPASTSFSRAEHKKLEVPVDSGDMPRLDGSERVIDEGIIKQGQGGTVIDSLSVNDSMENEDFGETADAEVGGLLSESLSTPNDTANKDAVEIEIDQVKDSKKKRKGKDSRSMKLFKTSIASFVKDVLKPSWRQGNMSKEAFKTIVKKTVDKVSGAMKGHRIPKSQAKITHYIDSSRGKLTKLVMGYVDKYVNA